MIDDESSSGLVIVLNLLPSPAAVSILHRDEAPTMEKVARLSCSSQSAREAQEAVKVGGREGNPTA